MLYSNRCDFHHKIGSGGSSDPEIYAQIFSRFFGCLLCRIAPSLIWLVLGVWPRSENSDQKCPLTRSLCTLLPSHALRCLKTPPTGNHIGCSGGIDLQKDRHIRELESASNHRAREDVRSSLLPLLTKHEQKCLKSTPRYNNLSLKHCRCEWATTILRIYNSWPPSLRFSCFWQLFDFLRAPNRCNVDFLWVILLMGLVVIPQKKNQAEHRWGSCSKCKNFGSGHFSDPGFDTVHISKIQKA